MKRAILFLFCCCACFLKAQNISKCSDVLYESNRLYEKGMITEAIALLTPCISKSGFNKVEMAEAYRLLALCYLSNNNSADAAKYVHKLLLVRPNYKNYPNVDNMDFKNLLNKYEVKNKVDFGGLAGSAINTLRIIKNYVTTNSTSVYYPKAGYQMGLATTVHIGARFALTFDPNIYSFNYQRNLYNVNGWNQSYFENMLCIGLPFSYGIKVPYKKSTISARCLIQQTFLLQSFGNMQSINPVDKSRIGISTETTDFRRKGWQSAGIGLGVSTKLGGGFISFRVDYYYSFSNIVNVEKRYENKTFLHSTQYVDSDFSTVNAIFNFAYQFPIIYSVKFHKDEKNETK